MGVCVSLFEIEERQTALDARERNLLQRERQLRDREAKVQVAVGAVSDLPSASSSEHPASKHLAADDDDEAAKGRMPTSGAWAARPPLIVSPANPSNAKPAVVVKAPAQQGSAASAALLKLYVPKSAHGAIIGRGAANIKRLEQDYNVRVRVPRADELSEIVTVQSMAGAAANATAKVKKEIEDVVGYEVGTEPLITANFDINPSKYGLIIGKSGSTLRQLQAECGCGITVPRDNPGPVQVCGSAANLKKAETAFSRVLGESIRMQSNIKNLEQERLNRVKEQKLDLTSQPINETLFFPEAVDSDERLNRMLAYIKSARKSLVRDGTQGIEKLSF